MHARQPLYYSPRVRGLVLAAACGLGTVFLAGCKKDEEIERYQAPKPPTLEHDQPVRYRIPEGWTKVPKAAMSPAFATFQVGEGDASAEVTITQLSGAAGGLLANVNRWRGQINLSQPLEEAQLQKELQDIQVDGTKAYAVDLVGPEGAGRQRILGVVAPRGDMTWFFKMRGPADLVEKQKAAFFDQFMASVRFRGSTGGKNG